MDDLTSLLCCCSCYWVVFERALKTAPDEMADVLQGFHFSRLPADYGGESMLANLGELRNGDHFLSFINSLYTVRQNQTDEYYYPPDAMCSINKRRALGVLSG